MIRLFLGQRVQIIDFACLQCYSFHQHSPEEKMATEKLAVVSCGGCQAEIENHEINFCSHCGQKLEARQKQYLVYCHKRNEALRTERGLWSNRLIFYPNIGFLIVGLLVFTPMFSIFLHPERLRSGALPDGHFLMWFILVASVFFFVYIPIVGLGVVPRLVRRRTDKRLPLRALESF